MVRILIGDPHPVVRRGVRALLAERPQWSVCGEARTGRELVEAAARLRPELVILEPMLRGPNGLEVIRELRRKLPQIEVLAFTGADSGTLAAAAVRAGARGCVLKSDPAEELVRAVDALARHVPYFNRWLTGAAVLRVGVGVAPRGVSRLSPLTPREREVVRMVAEGKRTREIAALLGISRKTVETHRTAILRKLHLQGLADLVRYAVLDEIVPV